jgi:hypothetical protein
VIPEILLLVKQIRPRRTEIDDFGASVAILLQSRALKAVKCVADAFAAADNALVLVVSEGALIAYANKSSRANVGVTDRTFAVAFVTESSEGDSCLLAAHNEIGVVARHGCAKMRREKFEKALEMRFVFGGEVRRLLRQRRVVGNARGVLNGELGESQRCLSQMEFLSFRDAARAPRSCRFKGPRA